MKIPTLNRLKAARLRLGKPLVQSGLLRQLPLRRRRFLLVQSRLSVQLAPLLQLLLPRHSPRLLPLRLPLLRCHSPRLLQLPLLLQHCHSPRLLQLLLLLQHFHLDPSRLLPRLAPRVQKNQPGR
jgi:hypothetical protein